MGSMGPTGPMGPMGPSKKKNMNNFIKNNSKPNGNLNHNGHSHIEKPNHESRDKSQNPTSFPFGPRWQRQNWRRRHQKWGIPLYCPQHLQRAVGRSEINRQAESPICRQCRSGRGQMEGPGQVFTAPAPSPPHRRTFCWRRRRRRRVWLRCPRWWLDCSAGLGTGC